MIIVTKPDATEEQIQHIVDRIKEWGLRPEVSRGAVRVVIGVVGPEDVIREKPLAAIPGVESVTPVLKPYKLVAHEFRQTASLVEIGTSQSAVRGWSSSPARARSRAGSRSSRLRAMSEGRRADAAWRGVQAADLALHLPGPGRRRPQAPGRGARGHRPARDYGDHGYQGP